MQINIANFRALSDDFEAEIEMRKLFTKARLRARRLLKEQLADFRQKRTVGLGNLYGPSDAELALCLDNRDDHGGDLPRPLCPFLAPRVKQEGKGPIDLR